MAKNNKQRLIKLIVSVVLLLCVIGSITIVVAEGQNKYQWTGEQVATKYNFGATLQIPTRTVGDGASVSHVLTYPDGKTSYADSVVLNVAGCYTLVYTAQLDNEVFNEKHEFSVDSQMYSLQNTKSSVVYGKAENTRNDNVSGLIVNLAKGDTLTFNKAISVADLSLDEAFLDGFIIPYSAGQSGFSVLKITLRDMENPDVYFTIMVKEYERNPDYGRAHMYVAANGQAFTCGEAAYGSNVFGRVVVYPDVTGAMLGYTTFGGRASIRNGSSDQYFSFTPYDDDYPFRFYYDASSQEVWHSSHYIIPGTIDAETGRPHADYTLEQTVENTVINIDEHKRFISDLDNPSIYSSPWSGFASGYVQLSITAENYNFDVAQMCITKVAGMDIEDTTFEITSAPTISVAKENLPDAKVDSWYTIPQATATDLYFGSTECTVEVMYNYNSSNAISAKVQDGKFYVDRPGYYAIIYSATNNVGQTSQKVLFVHASQDVQPIDISLDQSTMVATAQVLDFVPYATSTMTMGSGEKSLKVHAQFGDEIIDPEGGGFRPNKVGEWQIVYTATDEIGQVSTKSYTVNVTAKNSYTITDEIVLPKVIVSGGKYTLPKIYAKKVVNNQLEETLCQVSVTTGGQTVIYDAGDTVVVSVANKGEEVTIKYLCGGEELFSQTLPSTMPFENKAFDYTQLFVGTNVTVNKSEDGCVISLGSSTASFYYANPIVAENINVILRCDEGKAKYNEIVVTLIDSQDFSNSVQAKFTVVDGIVTMIVGDQQYKTGYVFDKSSFNLLVNFANNCFVWDTTSFEIAKTVSGANFNGFTSDKVYLQVDVNNVESGAEIVVDSIRSYNYDNQTADYSRPYYIHAGLSKNTDFGDTVTLPAIIVGDLISPSVKVTLTVKAPDGNVVKDVNGVELQNVDPFVEYQFVVDQIGRYRAIYQLEKDNDFGVQSRKEDYTCSTNVLDVVAPEITFTSDYTEEVRVGEVAILPNFTVTDNYSNVENIRVFIYVISPTGQYTLVTGNSIKLTQAGVYQCEIYAYDEAGNLTVEKLQVTVR